jgi:trigger factor
MEPPTFEFLVPLAPEVELKNHRDIRIDFEPKEVSEEDVTKFIDNLRDNQAVIEPVERPAEEGDMVYIQLSGEQKDEKDEEKKVILEERKFPVIVEKEDVDTKGEFPFPGFSRKLIGMATNDEVDLEHKFSKDYEMEDLQDVKAVYHVKVEEIKGRTLPELTDEFAASLGNYETVEDLSDDVRESLKTQFETEQNSEYENQIIDKLIETAEIKFPPQMLDHEIEHFVDDLNRQLAGQGMNIEMYLKSREIEMEGLREEIKPNAEERLKRGLILMEVANKEEISVSPDEVQEKTQQTIQEIKQYFPEEDARKLTSGDGLQGIISRIISDEITQRTLERLRRIAKGETIEEEEEEPELEEDEGAEPEYVDTSEEKPSEESTEKTKEANEDNETDSDS